MWYKIPGDVNLKNELYSYPCNPHRWIEEELSSSAWFSYISLISTVPFRFTSMDLLGQVVTFYYCLILKLIFADKNWKRPKYSFGVWMSRMEQTACEAPLKEPSIFLRAKALIDVNFWINRCKFLKHKSCSGVISGIFLRGKPEIINNGL